MGSTGALETLAPFALQEFELVEAAPGMALLRIAARAANGFANSGPPTLVVDDGAGLHRFRALPAPDSGDGCVRAGYSAPAGLVDSARSLFALELAHGVRVDLPPPRRRNLGAHQNGAAGVDQAPAPGHEALNELQQKLQAAEQWREEIEQRVASLIDERSELRASLDGKDESLAEIAQNVSERDAELVLLRDSLKGTERALEEQRARADALAAAYREKSHELEAGLERERAAVARVAEAGARATRLTEQLQDARSNTAVLESRVAEAHMEIKQLRAELERSIALRAEVETAAIGNAQHAYDLEGELAQLNSTLAELSANRQELSDRIAQLVEELAVAAAAREEAEQAAAQRRHEQEQAAASVTELEQRIEELSDEVSSVRAQLDQARSARDEARAEALAAREHAANAESAAETARQELTTALADAQIDRDALVLAREEVEHARQEAAEAKTGLQQASDASEPEADEYALAPDEVRVLEEAAERRRAARRAAREHSRSPRSREREMALMKPHMTRAVEAGAVARARTVDRRQAVRWIQPEIALGMCLLVLGVTVAVLFLTGAVRLGFAP